MMVAKNDDEALKRLGIGGGFFSFGIMHYYLTGMHTPGRTKVWERYEQAVKEDPTLAYGPGRGAIGGPDTVREFLRSYEASGVDEIILPLNPRSHEGTMESIEIMGKEILPEFIERDQKAVADKAKRLEPVIEKIEARRQPSNAPLFDETYAFGGLPTGRGGKFTAGRSPRRWPRSTRAASRQPSWRRSRRRPGKQRAERGHPRRAGALRR